RARVAAPDGAARPQLRQHPGSRLRPRGRRRRDPVRHVPVGLNRPREAQVSEALIEMQDVEKVFLTDEVETHALSNIHLSVRKNEWLSIVGPSGSGKTTLLAILGLLDTATGGQYLLDAKPVQDLSPSDPAHVRTRPLGFIFQSFN